MTIGYGNSQPCNCHHLFNHVWVKIRELEARLDSIEPSKEKDLPVVFVGEIKKAETKIVKEHEAPMRDLYPKNVNGSVKRKRRRHKNKKQI